MDLEKQILEVVKKHPGQTEREIAQHIFGDGAVQQDVNSTCRKLVRQGIVKRKGLGGGSTPFTYHLP